MFRILDRNGDGKISKEELLQSFNGKGIEIFLENTEQIIKEVDSNNSGYIDYTEFLVACRRRQIVSSVKDLETAFKCFDIDKNGKITACELKQILGNGFGGDSVWEKLIQEVDLNGDGELDINEFKTMMIRTAYK
jgi:calcium-dependent protein kinase